MPNKSAVSVTSGAKEREPSGGKVPDKKIGSKSFGKIDASNMLVNNKQEFEVLPELFAMINMQKGAAPAAAPNVYAFN
jgi:hypothetical protein